jgi:preprotein translocase subunit SecA
VQYHHSDFGQALAADDAQPQAAVAIANASAAATASAAQPMIRSTQKVGRNDPCPCGSGKKYKHCHGKLA